MTGCASTGNPPAAQRAQALIAGYLKRHRQLFSAYAAAAAQRDASAPDGGIPDAALEALAPQAPARLGDYAVYAVHFANHASGLCAALLPGPMDDEASFAFACEPLGEGLELGPREAAELMVKILLETPHNTDGSEIDDAQIGALSKDELRWILIADIAQREAEIVSAAFEKGDAPVDPPDRDIESLAGLLNHPAPHDREPAPPGPRE